MTYDTQPELIEIDGEVVEVLFPPQSELEKAAQKLTDLYGGLVVQTLRDLAMEQYYERVKDQQSRWGEPKQTTK